MVVHVPSFMLEDDMQETFRGLMEECSLAAADALKALSFATGCGVLFAAGVANGFGHFD